MDNRRLIGSVPLSNAFVQALMQELVRLGHGDSLQRLIRDFSEDKKQTDNHA